MAEETVRRFHLPEAGTYATRVAENIHLSQEDGRVRGPQVALSYFAARQRPELESGSFLLPGYVGSISFGSAPNEKGKRDKMCPNWKLPRPKMRKYFWWKSPKGYYYPASKPTNLLRLVYTSRYKRKQGKGRKPALGMSF